MDESPFPDVQPPTRAPMDAEPAQPQADEMYADGLHAQEPPPSAGAGGGAGETA